MSKKIEQRSPQRPVPHLSQQNLRPQPSAPNAAASPEPAQPTANSEPIESNESSEQTANAQRSQSGHFLFNKSNFVKAALGVVFLCGAIPYSLEYMKPTQVAQLAESDGEETGEPQDPEEFGESQSGFPDSFPMEPEIEPVAYTQNNEHSVNKADHSELALPSEDNWSPSGSKFDDPENVDLDDSVGSTELPALDDFNIPAIDDVSEETTDFSLGNAPVNNALVLPPLSATAPTIVPPPTFAAASPAQTRQPQVHTPQTPNPKPQTPTPHTVGISESEIVPRKDSRKESRSPYGHSIQNVKMQSSDASSYGPNTTHPMSDNDSSFANHKFEDDPYSSFDAGGPEGPEPPNSLDPLAARTSVNPSEVRPQYAAQSLQGHYSDDIHEDERDRRGERITPPSSAQPSAHSQRQAQHPSQQQTRSRRNSQEPYRPQYVKIRQGLKELPRNHEQIWCEYDISSFTKAEGTPPGSQPEQDIVKWIKKQTGEQIWHSEPFGILSVTSDTLYVYHTPKVQSVVAQIVDRFVNPHANEEVFTFRIVSLNGPNWLANSHGLLKPIRINSPGTRGWLLEKEDHARLIPDLTRRTDYKELCSPQFPIRNGREYVVSSSVPKNYTPDAQPQNNVWPGYATEMSVIHEGYKLSLTPLLGVDETSADIMIKCESLQVEKMHPVSLNVANRATSRQRITVESPQVSQFHLDEQIVWPKDKILLLSLGTIPIPAAAQSNDAGKLIPEFSRKLSGGPAARGHILLIVECRKL